MNVLKDIPYAADGPGRRKLIDEKHLLVMQIALKPGQTVPAHEANANVHLLVLRGSLAVMLSGRESAAVAGDLLPVTYKTPMQIHNSGDADAAFLVIKTPNPSEMK